ncbi:MAG: hypothetical protein CM1200mP17_13060 [Woeseia sp.]|nr:MAG: hypothetical protein CM1200mP17_13060 [Woeseia sp.]
MNDKKDLAEAERVKKSRTNKRSYGTRVTICDPTRIELEGLSNVGRGVYIDVNTVFEGDVELSNGVTVRPFTSISNSYIGENTQIKA